MWLTLNFIQARPRAYIYSFHIENDNIDLRIYSQLKISIYVSTGIAFSSEKFGSAAAAKLPTEAIGLFFAYACRSKEAKPLLICFNYSWYWWYHKKKSLLIKEEVSEASNWLSNLHLTFYANLFLYTKSQITFLAIHKFNKLTTVTWFKNEVLKRSTLSYSLFSGVRSLFKRNTSKIR